jgi:hypothetical protein
VQTEIQAALKTVGSSGQISIGKAYAGKTLRVTLHEDGSMLLTPVVVVPESQMWTLQADAQAAISRGMAYAAAHAPVESDLDDLAAAARAKRG